MSKLVFRSLRADEIDVRVQTVTEKGCSLLLYKDARCDMNILDETVGALDWKREHTRDNANCIVSIWDSNKGQWVSKEDTGTESNTEKEKGLASDSFKRACFNWGIGRELYTSPFIWVTGYVTDYKGKMTVKEKFSVKSIEVKEGVITKLIIVDSKGNIVFKFEDDSEKSKKEKAIAMITKNLKEDDDERLEELLSKYKRHHLGECTEEELKLIYKELYKK